MAKRKNKKSPLIAFLTAILVIIVSIIAEQAGIWDKALDAVSDDSYSFSSSPDISDAEGSVLDAYFIDVGQGDCSLFISDGKSMLIDCGESENAEAVIQTISDKGIEKLDYVVASHAHSDHMGAMAEIITQIEVDKILISEPCEDSSLTATYEKFMDAAEASEAEIILAEPDYTFTLGYAECTVLAPFTVSQSNENNNSVVMYISAGETSFLMTGDAEKTVEKKIIENYPNLSATILKVGHHGSSTSSNEAFISQISPEIAIIQCGFDNSYGHPHEETIETLDSFGIRYYRSDISGTMTVKCTKDDYSISFEEQ